MVLTMLSNGQIISYAFQRSYFVAIQGTKNGATP